MDHQRFEGVANVGWNPTFLRETKKGVFPGVYILNFNQTSTTSKSGQLQKRIRDEMRFDTPSLLVNQIQKDIAWVKKNVFNKPADPLMDQVPQPHPPDLSSSSFWAY